MGYRSHEYFVTYKIKLQGHINFAMKIYRQSGRKSVFLTNYYHYSCILGQIYCNASWDIARFFISIQFLENTTFA